MNPQHYIVGIFLAMYLCACAQAPKKFWIGQTDDNARVSFSKYNEIREKVEGKSYRDLVKLIGPGKFAGPTTDEAGYLFTWWSGEQYGGALMVVCNHEGKIIQHYYVMP